MDAMHLRSAEMESKARAVETLASVRTSQVRVEASLMAVAAIATSRAAAAADADHQWRAGLQRDAARRRESPSWHPERAPPLQRWEAPAHLQPPGLRFAEPRLPHPTREDVVREARKKRERRERRQCMNQMASSVSSVASVSSLVGESASDSTSAASLSAALPLSSSVTSQRPAARSRSRRRKGLRAEVQRVSALTLPPFQGAHVDRTTLEVLRREAQRLIAREDIGLALDYSLMDDRMRISSMCVQPLPRSLPAILEPPQGSGRASPANVSSATATTPACEALADETADELPSTSMKDQLHMAAAMPRLPKRPTTADAMDMLATRLELAAMGGDPAMLPPVVRSHGMAHSISMGALPGPSSEQHAIGQGIESRPTTTCTVRSMVSHGSGSRRSTPVQHLPRAVRYRALLSYY